jgi:hypothetical protein
MLPTPLLEIQKVTEKVSNDEEMRRTTFGCHEDVTIMTLKREARKAFGGRDREIGGREERWRRRKQEGEAREQGRGVRGEERRGGGTGGIEGVGWELSQGGKYGGE